MDRFLNVSLRPGSPAHLAYHARTGRPPGNLRFFGGKTIADLVYANHYLGGGSAWAWADRASIDAALAKAMSDSARLPRVRACPRGFGRLLRGRRVLRGGQR